VVDGLVRYCLPKILDWLGRRWGKFRRKRGKSHFNAAVRKRGGKVSLPFDHLLCGIDRRQYVHLLHDCYRGPPPLVCASLQFPKHSYLFCRSNASMRPIFFSQNRVEIDACHRAPKTSKKKV